MIADRVSRTVRAVLFCCASVFIGCSLDDSDATSNDRKAEPRVDFDLAETGFDFGVMSVGSEKSHEFTITNDGDAPLDLEIKDPDPSDVRYELSKNPIPPGESTTLTIHWKPTEPDERFMAGVTVITNDPARPEFGATVRGVVEDIVVIKFEDEHSEASSEADFGDIPESQSSVVEGVLYSARFSDLAINDIQTNHRLLSAEAEPLTDEQLAEHNAVAGYTVRFRLEPGLPIGPFELKANIHTNAMNEPLSVALRGSRPGPFRIIPDPNLRWFPKSNELELGRFEAATGRKTYLLFVVKDGSDARPIAIEQKEDALIFRIVRDEKSGLENAWRIEIEFPAGGAPVSHTSQNPVDVTIQTDHPRGESIPLKVQFVAY